jgi:hypothetical protein
MTVLVGLLTLNRRSIVIRQTAHSTYPSYRSYLGVQTSYWRVSRVVSRMARLTPLLQSKHSPFSIRLE